MDRQDPAGDEQPALGCDVDDAVAVPDEREEDQWGGTDREPQGANRQRARGDERKASNDCGRADRDLSAGEQDERTEGHRSACRFHLDKAWWVTYGREYAHGSSRGAG